MDNRVEAAAWYDNFIARWSAWAERKTGLKAIDYPTYELFMDAVEAKVDETYEEAEAQPDTAFLGKDTFTAFPKGTVWYVIWTNYYTPNGELYASKEICRTGDKTEAHRLVALLNANR